MCNLTDFFLILFLGSGDAKELDEAMEKQSAADEKSNTEEEHYQEAAEDVAITKDDASAENKIDDEGNKEETQVNGDESESKDESVEEKEETDSSQTGEVVENNVEVSSSIEEGQDGKKEAMTEYDSELLEDEQIYEGDEGRQEEEEAKGGEEKEEARTAGGSTTGALEDAIDFMVNDDDKMLEEEMIYEDGSTIKNTQVNYIVFAIVMLRLLIILHDKIIKCILISADDLKCRKFMHITEFRLFILINPGVFY